MFILINNFIPNFMSIIQLKPQNIIYIIFILIGIGITFIAVNLGMYIGLPAFGIVKVIQLRRKLVQL